MVPLPGLLKHDFLSGAKVHSGFIHRNHSEVTDISKGSISSLMTNQIQNALNALLRQELQGVELTFMEHILLFIQDL